MYLQVGYYGVADVLFYVVKSIFVPPMLSDEGKTFLCLVSFRNIHPGKRCKPEKAQPRPGSFLPLP